MDVTTAESVWSALGRMFDDLRGRGIPVSQELLESLTDCRRLINRHKTANGCKNRDAIFVSMLEELRKLEDMLVIEAFQGIGDDFAQEWESRLSQIWSSESVLTKQAVPLQT
ncbi:MAG: DUF2096 family protein [Thermoplasmata archaeon]|nr:DUF2096 family protein [Thermoplasmata archaeon]